MSMSFGSQFVGELARRRELGMYFDYAGYRELRRIGSTRELTDFLRRQGYADAPVNSDLGQVADWLKTAANKDIGQDIWLWIALDPLGGIIALPLWILHRLISRPPGARHP